MKKFTLVNASTVDEAVSSLSGYAGKAKVIAGGTELVRAMKEKINPTYPEALVNIKSIPDMDYIREEGGVLKIGALAILEDIVGNSTVNGKYVALAEAAHAVGTPLLRNMGTLGGNLCQEVWCWYYRAPKNYFYCIRKGGTTCQAIPEDADNRYNAILGWQLCAAVCPSDTAIALGALDATVVTNKRSIPILDFFKELGNDLGDDEIVTEVQVPEPESGSKQVFLKFRLRKAVDFAISSVAAVITPATGNVTDARIVLGGVAPVPYRATAAEDALKGNAITESVAEAAGAAAVKDATPLSKNGYIVQITKTLVKRAVLA